MEISSNVIKAVVYQKGAFLTRQAKTTLHKGSNAICIENLSDTIVAETIQISLSRGLFCSQVLYDPFYGKNKKQNQKPVISGEETELKKKKVRLQHQMSAARTNLELLPGKEIYRDKKEWKSEDLNDILDFLEKKRVELTERITDCEDEIQVIDSYFQNKSENAKESGTDLSGMISMEIESEEEGEFSFEILYYDREARWAPFYDLKIDSLRDPAVVLLKGRVIQNTGEIWKDVDMTLSTGNLQLSNNQPELIPWVLRQFMVPPVSVRQAQQARNSYSEETTLLSEATMLLERNDADNFQAGRNLGKGNSYKKNQTSVEYHVSGRTSIDSGGKGNIVQIMSVCHEAEYIYYITPKAECSAFLMARIKRRSDYHFLEADANIFLENRYVGATHLGKEDEKDEYMISLGRDHDIYVERQKMNQKQSQNLMGNLIRKDFAYQLRIRNRKTERIHVLLKDQIPITTDEKIHVDVINQSNANLDKKTGMLFWERDLAENEEWTVDLSFRVSWPKNYSFTVSDE